MPLPPHAASTARWAARTRWRCWGSFRCRAAVHQVFQFFARLEEWDLLCRNFHPFSRLRVSPHARLALASAEAAKPADFDLVAHPQRAHHAVKDRIHNHFAVFAGEFRQPGNFFDQVSLRHKLFAPFGAGSLRAVQWSRALPSCRCSALSITFSNLRGSLQVQFSVQFPVLSSQIQ